MIPSLDGETVIARLRRVFLDPPADARPHVWWHWMDGNIDIPGLRADLEWMHGAGIGGVQIFDGGMGLPTVVAAPVRPGSPSWDEAMTAATTRARELGLEVAVATSSGWSASGGPWVESVDAMKKIVWSEATVDGGAPVRISLPPLPTSVGAYQDSGTDDAARRFSAHWRVLAVPDDLDRLPLRAQTVETSSGDVAAAGTLTDGSFAGGVSLARDPDGPSEAWIVQRFAEPVTVRSVVVGLPGPRGFGAAPPARAALEAETGAGTWAVVVELLDTRAPVRSASFAPVSARAFRLRLHGEPATTALPPMADGLATPPVLRPARAFEVSEFALFTASRVHVGEAKAGFGVASDYYALDSPDATAGVIDPAQVFDLTYHLRDGILEWTPPPGRWRILRLGASTTGAVNGPALPDATGLEVDKLDAGRVRAYLETHLARFTGPAEDAVSALLSDSIEAGLQNWTDAIAEEFAARRGYDPTPWLPCLLGWVVGDAASADRFLYDYRRTLAELLSERYYGTLAEVAHERGWTFFTEALEDGRPQLGDDLAMRAPADVPMGAMWTFAPEKGPRPTYVADLRGAASVAHVYGAAHTGSEAFTAFEDPWTATPGSLKHVADLQLALGVTRFCIHSSPHQPSTAPLPGMALAPFLGQTFSRNETWATMARPWIDYLTRCSALLAEGEPAVEVAVFVGEEAPVTALFSEAPDDTAPAGYGFDYVGVDALVNVLGVADGRITARGASYAVLFLGGSSHRMTLAALAHIERLLTAGATVVGRAPEASPSLADDPEAFAAIRDRIWGSDHGGRLVATSDLSEALRMLGIPPAVVVGDPAVRMISRRVEGHLVTFVANPGPTPVSTSVSVSVSVSGSGSGSGSVSVSGDDAARIALWDPVTTTATALQALPGGPATFALELAPFGSAFLVAGADAPVPARDGERRVPLDGSWRATLPGHAPQLFATVPRLWTDDADRAGFSGVGTYETRFTLSAADLQGLVSVQFESVHDIAEILVGGESAGVVWTAPWRLDITDRVREGENLLAVRVATGWRNRLIAEAKAPSGRIYAPMTGVFTVEAAPRPAGLTGPVSLVLSPAPQITRTMATHKQ
ncbi:alpha-L-rhamnosidase-like protein [Microbacterium sp. SLBN-154]|uniref:glycosyl hydrolase n=1 Tax=Microbacterium sp. SLBN-154 TaxID=2768458 RepID=UPI0011734732|nr:glycosyl hydrolase [Microbacterium sp. SLBN-154]TQK18314.1 alpha-L-rhamnosidase-like protein [Microbacterium sp. SLBN-154]